MLVAQKSWDTAGGWQTLGGHEEGVKERFDLVLVFGGRDTLENPGHYDDVVSMYPGAQVVMCSTAGEILGDRVMDGSLVLTALGFRETKVEAKRINIADAANSFEAGKWLAEALDGNLLRHVLVFSDGQLVNGSELVKGMNQHLPVSVSVSGGLAGDGARFERTLVGLNQTAREGEVVAIGLYGDSLKVAHGSVGGWDSFGPHRIVTKSEGNRLYELDGKSALQLYKMYLGERAKDLPGSALLFPLSILAENQQSPVVRTILSIDEEDQAMIFAGDIPVGAQARLMKANFDRLIDGAVSAAQRSFDGLGSFSPDFALFISCIGRKLVLGERIEEEVEEALDTLGGANTCCRILLLW